MAEQLRIALIGIGVMGKKYAEMITGGEVAGMLLSAVVVRRSSMQAWAEALRNTDGSTPEIFADTDALFAKPQCYDAVLIVTPHKTHETLAMRAFSLGKHVMCDKPAGITVGQAERMSKQAKECGLIYGMMFHQRKYEKYQKIKDMLTRGELGRIYRIMLVNARYFRTEYYHKSGSWRSSWNGEGGGALMNQGAHLLDIWQWLFGMPQKLYAEIPFGKYNDFMVDDEATIVMRYPDKQSATFVLTTGEAVWEERLEIVGSKGTLLLEDDTMTIRRYSEDSEEYRKRAQCNSREELTIAEEVIAFAKPVEPYVQMLENFKEAVAKKEPALLTAPGEEAANQIMLTNAAYYSAWTGKAVELPLEGLAYEEWLERQCEKERS